MKASTQRVLRAICNIYGLMLLAYPDDFRSRYGREMLLALRNRAHDVLEGGSGSDLFAFVVHVSGDWVITALKENAMTGTLVSRLRWIAALPLAIVAADAAPWLSVYFIQDIRQAWIVGVLHRLFHGSSIHHRWRLCRSHSKGCSRAHRAGRGRRSGTDSYDDRGVEPRIASVPSWCVWPSWRGARVPALAVPVFQTSA